MSTCRSAVVETTSQDDGQSDRYDDTAIASARRLVRGRHSSRQSTPTGKIIVIVIVIVIIVEFDATAVIGKPPPSYSYAYRAARVKTNDGDDVVEVLLLLY